MRRQFVTRLSPPSGLRGCRCCHRRRRFSRCLGRRCGCLCGRRLLHTIARVSVASVACFCRETAAAEVCMAAYAQVHMHCSSNPAYGVKSQVCRAATRNACMRVHNCSCSQFGATLFTHSIATRQCRAEPRPVALPQSRVHFTPSTSMPGVSQSRCAPMPLISMSVDMRYPNLPYLC